MRVASQSSAIVRALLVGLIVSALAPIDVVHAQAGRSKKGDATAAPSEYDRVLREALAEFDRGNWIEARALFERAHELQPSARTLRAIGLCAFEEKRYVAALVALTQSLTDPRKPLTEAHKREVQDALRRAKGFIAQYTLELTPADAQVRVDGGEQVVMIEGKLQLDPGSHELQISADGYDPVVHRLVAQPREDRPLRFALTRTASAVATPAPQARPVSAPPEAVEPSDGDSGLSTQQWVGVGVAGAGVVSLGLSVYFGLHAKALYDDSGCADGGCADRAAKQLNDDALESGTIATITAIGGAVAVGAGAFLFFWSPGESEGPSEASASARLTPVIAPTFVGLHFGDSF